jgi:hypothetical protein
MKARTAAKWERDGWEIVSQQAGRLQSELVLRRPVRKTSKRVFIAGGAVLAVLAVVITLGATGVFGDDEGDDQADAATSQAATKSSEPEVTAPETTPSTPETQDASPLTAANNPEFAALLRLGDYCDDSVAAFSEKYADRVITFDGSIDAMNRHGDATTRYDILIGAGDFSTTKALGPSFQFNDVNTTFDMHYVGTVPDQIGVGTNLTVSASVGQYDPNTCLFQLDPVETAVR